MTTVLLARHGESDWNAAGRWQGHTDRPLTDRGRAQARELQQRLADTKLDAIYASDLERARETARIVAESRGLEVQQLPALREVDVGSWSGLTRAEAEQRFPRAYARWVAGGEGWDDGETYQQLSERVVGAVLGIAADHPGARLLVVSHGGAIRVIHAAALGIDVHTYRRIQRVEPNATLSAVCVADGRLTDLCPAEELDEFLIEHHARRSAAAAKPPTPAG